MTIPLYDDQAYYVLMRNKKTFAKLLKAEQASALHFVKGSTSVCGANRKYRDIVIARYGIEDFLPVRLDLGGYRYPIPTNTTVHDYLGVQHFRCHSDPKLEYLLVTIPIHYEEYVEFVVCKHGDLFKIARHNSRLMISDIEINKPILEDDLIADVLKNTYLFAKHSKRIGRGGIRLRRGVILDGKPGNGKTMLCAYIDSLCKKDRLTTKTVSCNQIQRSYSEGKLEKLFWSADVIFFDDIDIGFLSREGKHAEIASNILTAMDGLNSSKHCVVRIFTTNEKIDDLDPAFVRPGRIDAKFHIGLPDETLRTRLIQQWPKDIQAHLDTKKLIDVTDGLSFSQIEEIRSKMVINFNIDAKWDMDKALDEFNRFNQELKQKKLKGFAA